MSIIRVFGAVYLLVSAWILVPVFIVVVALICLNVGSTEIDSFLSRHMKFLTSVGTVVLVTGLALGAAVVSSRSAEGAQRAERDLSAELKLSDFRQNWIDQLRGDLAEVVSTSYEISTMKHANFQSKEHNRLMEKLRSLEARVRMRLNPDPHAIAEKEIKEEIVKLIRHHEMGSTFLAVKKRERIADIGAVFLKREWDVLKGNLENIKSGTHS